MRQDKLLDQYLDELAKNPDAQPPAGLDQETAKFARQLVHLERAAPSLNSTDKKSIWHSVSNPQLSNGRSKSPGRTYNMQQSIPYTTQPPLKMAWLSAAVIGGLILLAGLLIYNFSNNPAPAPGDTGAAGNNIQATETPPPPPTNGGQDDFVLPSYQSEPIPIVVGDPVEGAFTLEQDRFIYALDGKAGEVLQIRMMTTGSASVGFQILDRPQVGQVPEPSAASGAASGGGGGGGGGGAEDEPREFVMPLEIEKDSIVWIAAKSVDGQEKDFTLSIVPIMGTPISYDSTASGMFSIEDNANFFEFEGEKGDIINITTSSNLDLQLRLETLSGKEIASDDDGGLGLNPELYRVQLPEDGSYRIRVEQTLGVYFAGPADEESAVPDYELSLEQVDPITLDNQLSIDLLTKKPAEVLAFDAAAGESYTLEASTFFTPDVVSIVVVQGENELATMELLPSSEPTPNGISASREIVAPEDGPVKVFVNYVPRDRNSIIMLNFTLN
jgi:hypothetical protein